MQCEELETILGTFFESIRAGAPVPPVAPQFKAVGMGCPGGRNEMGGNPGLGLPPRFVLVTKSAGLEAGKVPIRVRANCSSSRRKNPFLYTAPTKAAL